MDFTVKNEGTWFYFEPNLENKGGVCLREITPEKMREIEKRTTTYKVRWRRAIANREPQVDTELANQLTWDYCIVDWKNVILDGRELPCTFENKCRMINCLGFIRFVSTAVDQLLELGVNEPEEQAKNSESS